MRSDRSRARALALLAVLAIHVALLWLLAESSTSGAARERHAAPLTRIALRLIAAPAPVVPPTVVVEPPVRSDRPKPPRPGARPNRTGAPPHPVDTAAISAPRREEAATQPEPAASAGMPAPSLLDTESTHRAIRASAREPSLGDQLARAREEPGRDGPQARLANDMKAAGKGDCLKGEFAGSGMGLLSLPFLVIAEARGNCAK